MTLGIRMFAPQIWNFHDVSKTTKQKIIYTNVTENLFMKKNLYRVIKITMVGSTENVYHVASQNLYFAHDPYTKNKNKKYS